MMDKRSEECLAHVHPDLVRLVREVAKTQRFIVIQGLRSLTEEQQAVASGHSQTMHSRHLPNAAGLSCAIDFMAMPGNHASWADKAYLPIGAEFKKQAEVLSIPIQWGGDWKSLKDWGHVELSWVVYP